MVTINSVEKTYSQIYFYFTLLVVTIPLINAIIIFLLQPTLGKLFHSGIWQLIGTNIIVISIILYLSTMIPFIIKISSQKIKIYGFIYKYEISNNDVDDVIITNRNIFIKLKNNKKFRLLYTDKKRGNYKSLGFVQIDDAFIDAVKFFLPLNPKIEIDWDYVPPKYKDKLREVLNERQGNENG